MTLFCVRLCLSQCAFFYGWLCILSSLLTSHIFQGYLKALGFKRTAEVKRDARIGEAEARRDAGIKVKDEWHSTCCTGCKQIVMVVGEDPVLIKAALSVGCPLLGRVVLFVSAWAQEKNNNKKNCCPFYHWVLTCNSGQSLEWFNHWGWGVEWGMN